MLQLEHNNTEYEIMLYKKKMAQYYFKVYNYYNDISIRTTDISNIIIEDIEYIECNNNHLYYSHHEKYKCINCGKNKELEPITIDIPLDLILKILRSDKELWYTSRSLSTDIRKICVPFIIKNELYKIRFLELESYDKFFIFMEGINYKEDIKEYDEHNLSVCESNGHITRYIGYYYEYNNIIRRNEKSDFNKIIGNPIGYSISYFWEFHIYVDNFKLEKIIRHRLENVFNIHITDNTIQKIITDTYHANVSKLQDEALSMYILCNLKALNRDINIDSKQKLLELSYEVNNIIDIKNSSYINLYYIPECTRF